MLIGAHGPDAAARVGEAAARLHGEARYLVVGGRGGLAIAAAGGAGAPAVAERGDALCAIDGEVRGARWRRDSGAASGEGPPLEPAELLDAWRALGSGVLDGLRGRFVLVLWDGAREAGLIVRDPSGAVGLVHHRRGEEIAFASEILPLLAFARVPVAADPTALAFWLCNDAAWATRTPLAGIAPLRPGHLLELRRGRAEERAWWTPRYRPPAPIALADAAAAVRDAITGSIGMQLHEGERVGVLLSGGLDSTGVAALASAQLGGDGALTAYSAVFPGHPQTDERERIETTAGRCGIASVRMAVHDGSPLAGAVRFISRWAALPPSPNCFFWPSLLERAQADGVEVLLGGEGGDELFALSPPVLADLLAAGRPLAMLALARRAAGGGAQRPRALARAGLREAALAGLPVSWLAYVRRPSSAFVSEPRWLRPSPAALHRELSDPFGWRAFEGPRWWAYSAHLLSVGRERFAVADGIRRMYESEQVRVHEPLLDPDVVELVLGLPPALAFDPRFDRPLLRAALRGMIPEEIRTRVSKSDFAPVLLGAIAGDLPLARELLGGPAARVNDLVDPRLVREQLLEGAPDRHPGGPQSWAGELWRLLVAECWLRWLEDRRGLDRVLERTRPTRTSFHLELSMSAT